MAFRKSFSCHLTGPRDLRKEPENGIIYQIMGKFFIGQNKYKKESVDSELAAFEEEFVSLEGEEYEDGYYEGDGVTDDTASLDYDGVSDDTASLDYTGEIGFETEPIEFDEISDFTAALDADEISDYTAELDTDAVSDETASLEFGDVEYEDSYGDYTAPMETVEEQEYYTEEIPRDAGYYTEEIPQGYTEEIPQDYTAELPRDEEFYTEEFPRDYTAELPQDAGYYTEEIPQDTASFVYIDDYDTSRFGETAELGYDTASLDYTAPLNTETAELQFDEVRFDTASLDIIEISKHTRSGDRRRRRIPSEDEMVDLDDSVDNEEEEDSSAKDVILKIAIVLAACLALCILGFGVYKIATRNRGNVSPITISEAGIPVAQEMIGSGSQLGGIDTIGGSGLLAALDARKAALMAVPEVHNEYNETQIISGTKVAIELITVKSDLKIKFVNAESGKLLPNIPFTVTVTDPSGSTLSWADDDFDGIIYKTNLKEGKYTVHVEQLTGDKYSGYTWPSNDTITVKSTIDYSRVDVNGEVKDASQVNESAEDTSGRGNGEGEDLTNTVTFVESSNSPIYTEVAKSTISNPLAALTSGGGDIVILTSESVSGNTNDVSGNNSGSGNGSGSGTDISGNNSGSNTPAKKPTLSVTLSSTTLSLKEGATAVITYTAKMEVATQWEITEIKSSNESVAKISSGSECFYINAVGGGSCEVTVKAETKPNSETTEKATADAKNSVTVTSVDMTPTLKDKSGNEVYVYENGSYRKATFADYAKFDKFYIITGTKYTGWQTQNGATYYYDSNGKPVTGTQVIQGVTYQFGADGKMTSTSGILGIDVSKWQGSIDWNAVKASGVDYVIIRVGYRGSSAGALIDDSKFTSNIQGAKAAGLKVGVYFVTQAINDVEAVYEASMVLDRIKNYSLDLPVFLDVEASGGRGDAIDKNTRTAVIIAFCETIRSAGYTAGIYANKTWLSTKMDTSKFGNYKIWVAHYSSVCGYTGRYDYWQYTEKGTVSGINGNVDMDLRYS